MNYLFRLFVVTLYICKLSDAFMPFDYFFGEASKEEAKFFSLPLGIQPPSNFLQKRDGNFHLQNKIYTYFAINGFAGSNAQNIMLTVFTSTGDSWLTGDASCIGQSECSGQVVPEDSTNFFIGRESSSFKKLDGTFSAIYDYGSATNGAWGQDSWNFGNGLSVNDFSFGVVYPAFISGPYPAVLGLARRSTNVNSNFIDVLYEQGKISKKLFALRLANIYGNSGSIDFGEIDEGKVSSPISYTPMLDDTDGYYITMRGVSYNGEDIGDAGNYKASLDSSVTSVYVPQVFYDNIASILGLDSSGSVDCDTNISLSFDIANDWILDSGYRRICSINGSGMFSLFSNRNHLSSLFQSYYFDSCYF
ncbi:unnamed protein product [[Candida] boidinii]|nr:unnamed protein product [[Candida] boidinii]